MPQKITVPLTFSYWVFPGEFLAGPYPGGQEDRETHTRMRKLLQAGINAFH